MLQTVACYFSCLATSLAAAQLVVQKTHLIDSLDTPCHLLNLTFPGSISSPGDNDFSSAQSAYWSAQQQELSPSCRFKPKNAQEIQEALADIIYPYNVSIAIVSGGQSSNVGASNVNDGITIDLSNLGGAMVVENGREVLIGSAARWQDVYYVTEPDNVTVAGARAGDIGAAGHLLGGGFSWFSGHHGWSSDNVVEFQLVTPMAEILNVNNHSYQDLFWALKGSAGAFGVITRITMSTIANQGVLAGALSYSQDVVPQLCDALEKLTVGATRDPATQGYFSFSYMPAQKGFTYTAYLVNTQSQSQAPALKMFSDIPHSKNTLAPVTMQESARAMAESDAPGIGKRRHKFTLTGRPTAKAMLALHNVIKYAVRSIDFDDGDQLNVAFEPITIPHLEASRSNLFSLSPADGPLLLVSVEVWWTDPLRDAQFSQAVKHMRDSMKAELMRLKSWHPWIYPNHAATDQNPLDAIKDPRTKTMLNRIKHKYDPHGLWRKHVPGIGHL